MSEEQTREQQIKEAQQENERNMLFVHLCRCYSMPVVDTDAEGKQIPNAMAKEIKIWIDDKLKGKPKNDLILFKDAFLREISSKFNYKPDVNAFEQVYDFVFPETQRHNNDQGTWIPLEQMTPQIEMKGLEHIERKKFDLFEYLTIEKEYSKDSRKSDRLYATFGPAGFRAIAKWKGEYMDEKELHRDQYNSVNWLDVYWQEKNKGVA